MSSYCRGLGDLPSLVQRLAMQSQPCSVSVARDSRRSGLQVHSSVNSLTGADAAGYHRTRREERKRTARPVARKCFAAVADVGRSLRCRCMTFGLCARKYGNWKTRKSRGPWFRFFARVVAPLVRSARCFQVPEGACLVFVSSMLDPSMPALSFSEFKVGLRPINDQSPVMHDCHLQRQIR